MSKTLSIDEFEQLPADDTAPVSQKKSLSVDEFERLGQVEQSVKSNDGNPEFQVHRNIFQTMSKGTEDFFGNIKESFKRGNDSSHLDMMAYSALTGEFDYEKDVKPIRQQFLQKVAEDPIKGSNFLSDAIYSVSGMLPAMGKGFIAGKETGAVAALTAGAASAIFPPAEAVSVPVAFAAGDAAGSMDYWRKQGAGNLYADLKEEGIDDSIAKPIAHIAGAMYGGVEFLQVSKLIPGPKEATKKLIGDSIKRTVANLTLKYGVNWAEQIGAQGFQEAVMTSAKDIASNIAGKTNLSVGEMAQKALEKGWGSAKESAIPMLLLMAPGMALEGKRIVDEKKATQQAVHLLQTIKQTGEKPLSEGQASEQAPEQAGTPDTAAQANVAHKAASDATDAILNEASQPNSPIADLAPVMQQIKASLDASKQPEAQSEGSAQPLPEKIINAVPEVIQALQYIQTKINEYTSAGKTVPDSLVKRKEAILEGLQGVTQGVPISGADINKKTGVNPNEKKLSLTERALLKLRLSSEARGAKAGFQAGFLEAREAAIAKMKEGQDARKDIADYAKLILPPADRGKFLKAVETAKTQKDVAKAFARIEFAGEQRYRKELVSDIQSKGERAATSGVVSDVVREKIQGILDTFNESTDINGSVYTTSQLEGVLNRMETMIALGKISENVRKSLYEMEKEHVAGELLIDAKPINFSEYVHKYGEKKKLTDSMKNKWAGIMNTMKKVRSGLTPMDGLAVITGMEKMKAKFDSHFGDYLNHNNELLSKRDSLLDRLDLKEEQFERIGIYAAAQQEGGYGKLENLGISKAEADSVKLKPNEKEYYDFVRETFDSKFPEIQDYMRRVYNKEVRQAKNYVSFLTDFDAMNELETHEQIGGFYNENFSHKTKKVNDKFTEKRTGPGKQKIKLNIDSIFLKHVDDVAYMLNLGEVTKMHFEIVNTPEMTNALGDLGKLAWMDWLDLMARKGGTEGGKQIKALDFLRRNLTRSTLPFRLSSALVQFSSFPDTVATLGEKHAFAGLLRVSDKSGRKFILDHFPEIAKEVGGDPAFLELGKGFFDKAAETGMIPLKKLDVLMRMTAALGAYEKVANERGVEVDYAKPDKAMINEATKLMRQSQGSSFFPHQPLAITKGWLTGNKSLDKTILQFQSFMLHRWNNVVHQIWREGIAKGNYAKAISATTWLVGGATALEMVARGFSNAVIDSITGYQNDREDDNLLGSVLLTTLGNVPIVGNLIDSMTYNKNPIPVIQGVQNLLAGATKLFTGVEDETNLKGLIDLSGGILKLFFGLPATSQVAELLKKSVDES